MVTTKEHEEALLKKLEVSKRNQLTPNPLLKKHKQVVNAPSLQFVFRLENGKQLDKEQGQYYTANVPLQEIEKDFNLYLQNLAADKGISLAKLKQSGYKATYNNEGNCLTLSFANHHDGQKFFNSLHQQNKVNGPFEKVDDLSEQQTTAFHSSESSTPTSSHRNPVNRLLNPFMTPRLVR